MSDKARMCAFSIRDEKWSWQFCVTVPARDTIHQTAADM